MRNKKWMSLLIISVLVFVLTACGTAGTDEEEARTKDEKEQKTLYEHGLDVIELMVEATRNEAYLKIFSTSEDIAEILTAIGEGDYGEPDKVLAITGEADVFAELLDMNDIEGLSKDLEKNLNKRLFGAVINQINARSGSMALAASSICSMGKTFVDEDVEENVLYLYIYEDANAIAVTFIPGEDGAVSAGGCFVMDKNFKDELEDIDDLEEACEEIGLDIEEVDIE